MHMLIGRIRFISTRIEPWNVVLSPVGCTSQHQKFDFSLSLNYYHKPDVKKYYYSVNAQMHRQTSEKPCI